MATLRKLFWEYKLCFEYQISLKSLSTLPLKEQLEQNLKVTGPLKLSEQGAPKPGLGIR